MNQTPVKLGPLALMLTVISICLAILSILTFTTAQADMRLAMKYADTVTQRYMLEAQGHEAMKELSDSLKAGDIKSGLSLYEAGADGVLYRTFTDGDLKLVVGIKHEEEDNGYSVVSWKLEHDWIQSDTIDNLWPGLG